MEWSILFMGSVGAGKTQAIQTLSDIPVVGTEKEATDEVKLIKSLTTVSMDMGVMHLDQTDKLRLLGAPGQKRFDFMLDILLDQAKGIILLVDQRANNPLEDLHAALHDVKDRLNTRIMPLMIGITHTDEKTSYNRGDYLHFLDSLVNLLPIKPPLVFVDTRNKTQMRTMMVGMAAMLEMHWRFENRLRR